MMRGASAKQTDRAGRALRLPEGLQVRVLRVENICAPASEQRKAQPFAKPFRNARRGPPLYSGIDVFRAGERFVEVRPRLPGDWLW
jgi:hypothetical protein